MKAVVQPWWVLAWRGSLAALFALATAVLPVGLGGLVSLFGAFALLDGATNVVVARAQAQVGQRWRWLGLEGGVGMAVGLAALFGASMNGGTATALIAVWAVGRGVASLLEVGSSWQQEREQDRQDDRQQGRQGRPQAKLPPPHGLPSLAFGLLLLVAPGEGSLGGPLWIGAFAMIWGLTQIGRALRVPLRGLQQPALSIAVPPATPLLRLVPIRWRPRAQAPR
jgi:uncharacterized membrane protein HdeD (DUF308 family)